MTPRGIQLLLSVAMNSEIIPGFAEGISRQYLDGFIEDGILTEDGNKYFITGRGRALISLLCDTQMPTLKEVWVDSRGEVIDV